MNKTELVAKVAANAGISKSNAEKALNATLSCITEALSNHDKVHLIGFGSFEVKKREAHLARNPLTKEQMTIPERNVVKFTPGKLLKESVK